MLTDGDDIPYGTEIFVIVPDCHFADIAMAKNRLYDSLGQAFPQFKFSLGRGLDDGEDEFLVMAVAGKVGDGRNVARPIMDLDADVRSGIVRHMADFVSGGAGKAN